MRKYYQAGLAIIAVLSLASLLFYRHEYKKLRYVLEVLNYFGHPSEKVLQANCTVPLIVSANMTGLEHSNYYFDEPMPSWQRLNDDAYVYAAYAIDDREIRAIAFARVKKLRLFTCEIYYENVIEPVIGDFSYRIIELSSSIDNADSTKKGIYTAYHLICTQKSGKVSRRGISGVSFANQAQLLSEALVIPVRTVDYSTNGNDESAICVAPTASRPILESDMISFIDFHISLGIRHFIVYDFGIPQRFNSIFKKISRISSKESNFSYTTVPWNFPFSLVPNDVSKRVVEADCRYRTYKNVGFVATLTWDEYIVMNYHHTVNKLFRDIDDIGFIADRYKISTKNYCNERNELTSADNTKPIVLGSDTIDENRPIYLYRPKTDKSVVDDAALKTRETTSDIILVYRYERHCNHSLNLLPQDNPYVGKFSKNIKITSLYKLFKVYAH